MLARNSRILLQLLLLSAMVLIVAVGCIPEAAGMFVLMTNPGTTEDGLDYDRNDILFYDPDDVSPGWGTLFDGEWFGLDDAHHAIGAFSFNDLILQSPGAATVDTPGEMDLFLSFRANRARVPGVADRVTGQDIVHFYTPDGTNYQYDLYFDGSDVGLTKGTEKIDGFSVWPPEYFDLLAPDVTMPYDCHAGVIFISTRGNYRVSSIQMNGSQLIGNGSDVLAFCATNLGADTAGFWFRVFQSSQAEIFPPSVMTSLDVFYLDPNITPYSNDYGNLDVDMAFFFTARNPFQAAGGVGGDISQMFVGGVDSGSHWVEGPFVDLNDPGMPALNGQVTGIAVLETMTPPAP